MMKENFGNALLTHNDKTRCTRLSFGNKFEVIVNNKKLDDATLWPLCLVVAMFDITLKLEVPKPKNNKFVLKCNDRNYEEIIFRVFRSDSNSEENLSFSGKVSLNGEVVTEGTMDQPFSTETLKVLCDAQTGGEATTSIVLSGIQCTSDTATGLFDVLAHLYVDTDGLQELTLQLFEERMFPIDKAVMTGFVQNCSQLKKLHLTYMSSLSVDSRNCLAELATEIITIGAQLTDISLYYFGDREEAAAEQGVSIMQSALDHCLVNFTNINMSGNKGMFKS